MPVATAKDDKEAKLIVLYQGGIYDITEFINDHPGGVGVLEEWRDKDITGIFEDPAFHKHSKFAHNMLKKYRIDDITVEQSNNEAKEAEQHRQAFINLNQPLVSQIWNLKISKEDYLREVHIPRHLNRPARFFVSEYLEIFTRTPWWFIPLFWGPVSLALGRHGITQLVTVVPHPVLAFMWIFGFFAWSLIEYCFHRFIFHVDGWLPNNGAFFTVHFLFHGVHHFLPMDKYRLVMPPVMFGTFAGSVFGLLSFMIPRYPLLVMFSGAMVGYISYDLMHYFFHHGTPSPIGHVQRMKTYHMDHHYVNENLGFGVTTKIWDRVFGTLLPENTA